MAPSVANRSGKPSAAMPKRFLPANGCRPRKADASRSMPRIALHLAPHAQQVAAPDLGDVGVAEAGAVQRGGHVARLAGVLPAGDAAAAVEVRGDADVVDAGDVGDVADLLDV